MREEFREKPDLARLFQALQRYEIRYVLFGTVGLIAYGLEITTGDLDICPALNQTNFQSLQKLLSKSRGFRGFDCF